MQEQMAKKIGSLEANKVELTKKLEEKDADIVKLKIEREQLKRTTDMEVRCSPGQSNHPAATA
jgi:predicted RNase H-like nuclease (RuvC/YqgF family)